MKHKIEMIDYLRGLSILAIVMIHVLAWHDRSVITEYTSIPALFALRNILQFSVVTIILCSGFSLYLHHQNLSLKSKDIFNFYKKRIKRILIPWWIFLIIFFSIQYIIKFLFKVNLVDLSYEYIISSFLMVKGIGFGWLILIMLILTILFPFLNYAYKNINKKILFTGLPLIYLVFIALFQYSKFDIYNYTMSPINILGIVSLTFAFILGWSLVYLISFLLEDFYNNHLSVKRELRLSIFFTILFIIVNFVYNLMNSEKLLYLNKYPPSPYYLSFGLMITFFLMLLFFTYKKFIHSHFKKILSFFSSNSYWLFMWNALSLTLITRALISFNFGSVYIKLILDILLNLTLISIFVILQKKLIKIKIHQEKHHF